VDFSLYVDEFQNFSTDSFATIMSEARKYHLNLIVANQFTTQLTDEVRDAVFGNMGTIVSFRVGQNDVEALTRYFQPIFDGDDLLRVPNYNTIVRTLIGGVPTQPFSMATLPGLGTPNPRLSVALKQLSAAKYGQPRAVIEKEINERMRTKTPPAPDGQNMPGSPFATPASAGFGQPAGSRQATLASATPPSSGSSFLDDWLNKRRSGQPQPSPAPFSPQPATVANGPAPAMQAPPPMAPSPAPAPSPSPNLSEPVTKNISSGELEQKEVDKIAAELKQELDTPAAPAPAEAKPAEPKKATGHIELKPGKDDTIFIDQEGTLHLNQDDKK
jgi:hypothetical protein